MVELIPFQLLLFYMVPFLIAAARGHDGAAGIGIANVLLGWTVLGWIVLFGVALTPAGKSSVRP